MCNNFSGDIQGEVRSDISQQVHQCTVPDDPFVLEFGSNARQCCCRNLYGTFELLVSVSHYISVLIAQFRPVFMDPECPMQEIQAVEG